MYMYPYDVIGVAVSLKLFYLSPFENCAWEKNVKFCYALENIFPTTLLQIVLQLLHSSVNLVYY